MTQQAVTETETGTIPGTVEQAAQVASAAKGKTPGTEKQVSPEDKPTISQNQVNLLLQQATSEAGRLRKIAEDERDTFKTQIQTKESDIGSIRAERDSLQEKIEGLTENDPKKFDLVRQDRELREKQRLYETNLHNLEERETKVNERVGKAETFEAEVLMETIADEYEDKDDPTKGDKAQLIKMCTTAGAKTDETIRQVADILWGKAKAPTAEKKTPLKKVTGNTLGGGTESLEDLLQVNVKKLPFAERAEFGKKLEAARKNIT